jgi:P-type E1-E2 ATPase
LQVSARVRRDSSWQVIPSRELVPGDIVRVRPGDIIPADVKLLTGALTVDQFRTGGRRSGRFGKMNPINKQTRTTRWALSKG